mmetsp:Transcript_16396/g.36415  ORF Transcript_16396/g.36415 Transcript_16396/m.36415 type:complete len:131 (-) Transcript_16396:328-720(-)
MKQENSLDNIGPLFVPRGMLRALLFLRSSTILRRVALGIFIVFHPFQRQKNGRTNRKGARKGIIRREEPQVKTDIIMAPTMTQRSDRDTMKQPPRTLTAAWMVALFWTTLYCAKLLAADVLGAVSVSGLP